MKMRFVIEIGADGIVRVVDSTPIAEHGDSATCIGGLCKQNPKRLQILRMEKP